MNTTITKKQVFGIIAAATYIKTISSYCDEDECYPEYDPDVLNDTGTFLLALTQELMPEDKEFDSFRDTINNHLNK